MKRTRKISIFTLSAAMIICAIFLISSSVKAYETRAICQDCKCSLSTSGQFMNGWYTYHDFNDDYGSPVTCAIYHYVERITVFCPNCYRVYYVENRQTDNHTHPSCPLH